MIIIVSLLEVVGSQRHRHPQPATDRPVQGTTPSRRRETPDRPIGGGKGGRRLCGRNPGSAVFLCKRRCKNTRDQHRPNQNQKTTEYKTRTETPPRKPEPNKQPSASDGEKKKKKQKRERNLGVGVGEEVRVVVVVRVQEEENTRGTPNPPKGVWVPQRLREREEKRKHGVDDNQPDTKRRRDPYKKPNTGRGLKGSQTKQTTTPRDKNAKQSSKEQKPRP